MNNKQTINKLEKFNYHVMSEIRIRYMNLTIYLYSTIYNALTALSPSSDNNT